MWFVFPQVAGLGTSDIAIKYAISSEDEARAYVAHPVLGARLHECCEALLAADGDSATNILGTPDDLKALAATADIPDPTMEDAFIALIRDKTA